MDKKEKKEQEEQEEQEEQYKKEKNRMTHLIRYQYIYNIISINVSLGHLFYESKVPKSISLPYKIIGFVFLSSASVYYYLIFDNNNENEKKTVLDTKLKNEKYMNTISNVFDITGCVFNEIKFLKPLAIPLRTVGYLIYQKLLFDIINPVKTIKQSEESNSDKCSEKKSLIKQIFTPKFISISLISAGFATSFLCRLIKMAYD